MLLRFSLLALAVFLLSARAGANPAEPQLFSCEGVAFRDYDRADLLPEYLGLTGHQAHFEILQAPGKPFVWQRSVFTYNDVSGRRRQARRTMMLVSSEEISPSFWQALHRSGFPALEARNLPRVTFQTFVNFPADVSYPVGDFFEYVRLPNNVLSGINKDPFTADVKIAQESKERGEPASVLKTPVRSKFYRAECVSQPLTTKEYAGRRRSMLSTEARKYPEGSEEEALFANLREAFRDLPLYSAEGALLAGPAPSAAAAGVGAGLLGAFLASKILRALVSAVPLRPALLAWNVPGLVDPRITLDLRALAVTPEEARYFFAAPATEQRALCAYVLAYRPLCDSLAALDYEIAYARGRAL